MWSWAGRSRETTLAVDMTKGKRSTYTCTTPQSKINVTWGIDKNANLASEG